MTVTATISLDESVDCTWEVVVIGAGPAGAFIARQLAFSGMKVLLVDRSSFPREKVCGGCMNASAIGVLEQVGATSILSRIGIVPLRHLRLSSGNRHTSFPLSLSIVISREEFDAALVEEAIAAGSHFLPETLATVGKLEENLRLITLKRHRQTRSIASAIVIGAWGLNGGFLSMVSPLVSQVDRRSRLGAGAIVDQAPSFYEPGTIYMGVNPHGYVGLVRRSDDRLDVAASLDVGYIRKLGSLESCASDILHHAGLPSIPRLERFRWRGTPALTRRPRTVARNRIFLLGDAAGYVEPFTGEGIGWALSSAVALEPIITSAEGPSTLNSENAWNKRHHLLLGRGNISCRIVTSLLRRPMMVDMAMVVLPWLPGLRRRLVEWFSSSRVLSQRGGPQESMQNAK